MVALLNGRSSRRTYWGAVGAIVVTCALMSMLAQAHTGLLATWLWVWVAAGRLHDLGRSGWWGAAVVVFIAGAIAAAGTVGSPMVEAVVAVGAVLQMVVVFWLGLARGEAGENRFGLAPAPVQPAAAAS